MSEAIGKRFGSSGIRLQLLATVSVLALVGAGQSARAADDDQPIAWVELGGQLERNIISQELFAPSFVSALAADGFKPATSLQSPPQYSYGAEGRISFVPLDSGWIFSAAVRYGRSNGNRRVHEQTPEVPVTVHLGSASSLFIPHDAKFSETRATFDESHIVADFQAGRDVGLGLFGQSVLNFGVRFAQFNLKSSVELHGDPDYSINSNFLYHLIYDHHHTYAGLSLGKRSFLGVGPSILWNGSAPLVGNTDAGSILFDWGVNGAVLFGRQKVVNHHQTTANNFRQKYNSSPVPLYTNVYHHVGDVARQRTIVVSNAGAFAGLSFRYAHSKVSFGYRADMFFGAMDGGIAAAKKENVGFYGPFATISVGIGG